jgi:predicted ester cyclase
MLAQGDKVVSRWSAQGTHRGDFLGVRATGKQMTVTGILVTRHANGKNVETWSNWDALGLLQQLGAVPAKAKGAGR